LFSKTQFKFAKKMFGRSSTRLIGNIQQLKVGFGKIPFIRQSQQQSIQTFDLSNQLQCRENSTSKLDSNQKTFAKTLFEKLPSFQKPKSSHSISTETTNQQQHQNQQSTRKSQQNKQVFVGELDRDNESNNNHVSEKSDNKQDLVMIIFFLLLFVIFFFFF